MASPYTKKAYAEILLSIGKNAAEINARIERDRNLYAWTWRNLALFRKYVIGDQPQTLTEDQKKILQGILRNAYCDNVCEQIVDEHSDRLQLLSVAAADDAESKWLQDVWVRNAMDDLQAQVHQSMIREGNCCVMSTYDSLSQRSSAHLELWYDGVQGMFISYNPDGTQLYAVKEWRYGGVYRRTLYVEGALIRLQSNAARSGWSTTTLPSDPLDVQETFADLTVILQEDANGAPLSSGIIHFRRVSNRHPYYGTSILDGGVLACQDQINDLQYDISAAARMTGYQQTTSKGFALQKDGKGRSIPPKIGPGVHHHADEETAEWGVLQPGSVQSLVDTYMHKVKSVCRMTRTPFHIILGTWPSGEAIYRAEQPVVQKAKRQLKSLRSSWAEVFHRMMEFANVYGKEGLDERQILTPVFDDPSNRDPLTISLADQALWTGVSKAVASGIKLEFILKKLNWNQQDIEDAVNQQAVQVAQGLSNETTTNSVPDSTQ